MSQSRKKLTCETTCFHIEVVKSIKQDMIDNEKVQGLTDIFKALASPTRFKILYCLKEEELCVCDISAILNMSQSAISHQLRVLRDLRLVKHRKEGKMVYYSLDDDHVFSILDAALEHISHE